MQTNPVLEKLGYSSEDRVIVFHADDIGMNQASVTAYEALLKNSPLSSAAVMVPCPWFSATAALIREHVNHPNLDMGVHLTVTSEWESMRWGPLSTTAVSSGIIDNEGYFYPQSEPVQQNGVVDAVALEIDAQIRRAMQAGIDPTHVDSHMGTLFHPKFLPAYMQAAAQYQLPFLGLRLSEKQFLERGHDKETAVALAQTTQQLEAEGKPLFDSIQMMPLHEKHDYKERFAHAQQLLEKLPAGLHYFIIHPSYDTPEIKALTPNWRARLGDLQLFLDDAWGRVIGAGGFKVIGMKPLKSLLM